MGGTFEASNDEDQESVYAVHSSRLAAQPLRQDRHEGVHGFEGRYREVTPPERIVSTFEWDGMPGYVIINSMTLTDLGDGRTKMVTTSLFHTPEERDGMLHSGMEGGMNQSYEALDRVLESMS